VTLFDAAAEEATAATAVTVATFSDPGTDAATEFSAVITWSDSTTSAGSA